MSDLLNLIGWEHDCARSFPVPTTGKPGALYLVPITLRTANDFVSVHHRHSGRTVRDGGKWACGAAVDGTLIGVAIVGRPVARLLADHWTAEVLRVCVEPDAPLGTCSMLYQACWRAWKAMGGRRLVTYTLDSESGASLRGAGWTVAAECRPGQWDRPGRGREHRSIYDVPKLRWEQTCS